jgi:phosphoribosylglycinamide formyltransferase-1
MRYVKHNGSLYGRASVPVSQLGKIHLKSKAMATKPSKEDLRLARLTKICLALPEAKRDYNGQHAGFQVGKRTFAYFLNDHHGDGIVAVTCKVLPGDHKVLAASNPDKFYIPAYIGSRGWVALRLDRGEIDWEEVGELVTGSYRLVTPKTLAARVAQK